MKFTSKKRKRTKAKLRLFLFGTTLIFNLTCQAQFAVVFSGHPQPWQKKVVEKFIKRYQLVNSNLIHYDHNNLKCEIANKAILQICFTKKGIKVIRYQQKRVKKTLGRYFEYAQTEKAHTKEGLL